VIKEDKQMKRAFVESSFEQQISIAMALPVLEGQGWIGGTVRNHAILVPRHWLPGGRIAVSEFSISRRAE
jgi:hypothetical protein